MNCSSVMYFVIGIDGEFNGWIGFASAESVDSLFQIIDATIDPYSVAMIESPKNINICFRISDDEEDYEDHEIIGAPSNIDEIKEIIDGNRTYQFSGSAVGGTLEIEEVQS